MYTLEQLHTEHWGLLHNGEAIGTLIGTKAYVEHIVWLLNTHPSTE